MYNKTEPSQKCIIHPSKNPNRGGNYNRSSQTHKRSGIRGCCQIPLLASQSLGLSPCRNPLAQEAGAPHSWGLPRPTCSSASWGPMRSASAQLPEVPGPRTAGQARGAWRTEVGGAVSRGGGAEWGPAPPGCGLQLRPGFRGLRVRGWKAGLGLARRRLLLVGGRARRPLLEVQLQQRAAVHGLQLLEAGPQRPGAARLRIGAAASRRPVRAGLLGARRGSRRLLGRSVASLAGEPQGLTEEAAVFALEPPVLQPQPGVLLPQPRVLPVPLVPRAEGLQVARRQVGEALLQLRPGAVRTASPAHAAAAAAAPTTPARAALPAAGPAAASAAAAPSPAGATTHAPHRSRPHRAAGRGRAPRLGRARPAGRPRPPRRRRLLAAGQRRPGTRLSRRVLSAAAGLPRARGRRAAHTQRPWGAGPRGQARFQRGPAWRFLPCRPVLGRNRRPRPAPPPPPRLPGSVPGNLKANGVSPGTAMWAARKCATASFRT